jgi:4-amino-4-deoxy-L-arabinose transferase-like glycosyltransferase
MDNQRALPRQWVSFGLLLFFLGIGAFFRFTNLRSSPGWYPDEGYFIDFASHLAGGRWEFFGVVNAPMLLQRPPLFVEILAGLFKLFGADILILRQYTATCSLLTMLVVFFFTREAFGKRLAFLTLGLLAIWPWIVAYNRMGFTYNQLSLFVALALYACWKYASSQRAAWLLAACAAAGLAISTDFLGAIAPLTVAVTALLYNRRWLVPAILLPMIILTLVTLPAYLANPAYFLPDLSGIASSRGDISLANQILNLLFNYGELIRRETWIILGLIGLFLLPANRGRNLVWFVVGVSLLVIIRTITPVGYSLHYLIHLFPWIVLGIAAFFERAFFWVYSRVLDALNDLKTFLPKLLQPLAKKPAWDALTRLCATLILFYLLLVPVVWMFLNTVVQSVYGGYVIFTGENDLTLAQERDVEAVNAFLRGAASPDDLIVGPSHILWSVPGRKTELATTLLFQKGHEEDIETLGSERFAYPQALENARFVILHPLTRKLTVRLYQDLDEVIAKVEQWPLVYQSGEIEVYENPTVK